jgi:hypothetical protein
MISLFILPGGDTASRKAGGSWAESRYQDLFGLKASGASITNQGSPLLTPREKP